jgi:hypothetical protein
LLFVIHSLISKFFLGTMPMNRSFALLAAFTLAALATLFLTPEARAAEGSEKVVLTRLFFQDDAAKKIRWADLYAGSPPTLGPVQDIVGFPAIDPETQSLVQMGSARGMLLVGVRDEEDGKKQSGWVLIDSGVGSEEHQGHAHSTYQQAPRVRAAQLDDQQGNPAHLYVYDQVFYLANDKLAGYTRLDPARIRPTDDKTAVVAKAEFIPGGGGHITLAAFQNSVGYSTWTDRAGDNQGRVDVTPFNKRQIAYSLKLPSGGLHGATANSGKVFFAPVDGICWVAGDKTASQTADQVAIHHISLGKDAQTDKPIRTGSFTNLGKHVLFTTGSGASAALNVLDASAATPVPHKVELKLAEGARPVGPIVGMATGNWPMALVFHDHAESSAEHHVSLVELDPNGDGSFADARIGKTLPTGPSKVDGHAGHHDGVFLADRRHAIFTNPGNGTLGVLRVRRMESAAEFNVGGVPSKIEAIGEASGH